MSGKRQEVAIAAGDSKAAAPGVDQRLIETSRHGPIPKVAPDGARAADVYARPIKAGADKVAGPRVGHRHGRPGHRRGRNLRGLRQAAGAGDVRLRTLWG